MKQQRMSNEQLAQECQARAVKLDTEGIEPASAELLLGACYALTEQATRIRELEGALEGLLAWEQELGGWEASAWENARRVLGGGK